MNRVKNFLKKNRILVKLYEDIGSLRYFTIALKNTHNEKKKITQQDVEKIKKFENIYPGQRCFIIGSGPSLKLEDLEAIKGELSFGVNSDYKIYNKTTWRPQYYVIMDDSAFDIFGKECYMSQSYEAFFYKMFHNVEIPNGVKLVNNGAYHFMIGTLWNKLFPRFFPIAKFSNDISKVVYSGKTVIYAAIQIAAYMGFKEIYLLGVDCNYTGEKTHADGMRYNFLSKATDERLREVGYMMRLQFAEMKKRLPEDVKVYNASSESVLDIFPKVPLKALDLK